MVWCAGVPTVLGGDGSVRAVNPPQYTTPRGETFKKKKETNKTKGENAYHTTIRPSIQITTAIQRTHILTSKYSTAIQIPYSSYTSLHSPAIWGHSDTSQTICCTNHCSDHRLPIIAATSTQHILDNKKNVGSITPM